MAVPAPPHLPAAYPTPADSLPSPNGGRPPLGWCRRERSPVDSLAIVMWPMVSNIRPKSSGLTNVTSGGLFYIMIKMPAGPIMLRKCLMISYPESCQ